MPTKTSYFKPHEFKCKCASEACDAPAMDKNFVELLNVFREKLSVPCSISSGLRCKKHNAAEGGSKNSAHLYGRAVDILTFTWSKSIVLKAINIAIDIGFQGVGEGHGILHLDTMHAYRLRWDYDSKGKAINFRHID